MLKHIYLVSGLYTFIDFIDNLQKNKKDFFHVYFIKVKGIIFYFKVFYFY